VNLTEAELSQYDGSDPSKPIYIAIEYCSFRGCGSQFLAGMCMMFRPTHEVTARAADILSLRVEMQRELLALGASKTT
jgi:hypothetical protein